VSNTQTPLHQLHAEAGASFTDFAGWQMPVRYTSDLAEHHAVREAAGLFDLSHMAEIRITGDLAPDALDYALASNMSAVPIGDAKYTLCLNEQAGIIDDLVVYRLGETEYLVVANASNRHAVVEALTTRAEPFGVSVEDETDDTVMVAVQGPLSPDVVSSLGDLQLETPLHELGYYQVTQGTVSGGPVLVTRTGYTGEDGFEIYVPSAAGEALWRELVAVGGQYDLQLCGLAARDTLRLEAGMALYGNELDVRTRPGQVRLSRVVDMDKDDFVGKQWLVDHPEQSDTILVGLRAEGRRSARAGYQVIDPGTMEPVGSVTSGALSPTLGHPVAMALINRDYKDPDTELHLDVRGQMIPATVIPLPFYRRRKD